MSEKLALLTNHLAIGYWLLAHSWDECFIFFWGGGDLGGTSGTSGSMIVVSGLGVALPRQGLIRLACKTNLLLIAASIAAFSSFISSRTFRSLESSVRRSRLIIWFRLWAARRQSWALLVASLLLLAEMGALWSLQALHRISRLVAGFIILLWQTLSMPSLRWHSCILDWNYWVWNLGDLASRSPLLQLTALKSQGSSLFHKPD